jgi:hypothetical protein
MGTIVLILYVSVLMASLPLLLPYLIKGHDMTFHLNRILGIEETLKSGMFPVRLNGYSLNGYGYADPVFYPQLFLYIPPYDGSTIPDCSESVFDSDSCSDICCYVLLCYTDIPFSPDWVHQ